MAGLSEKELIEALEAKGVFVFRKVGPPPVGTPGHVSTPLSAPPVATPPVVSAPPMSTSIDMTGHSAVPPKGPPRSPTSFARGGGLSAPPKGKGAPPKSLETPLLPPPGFVPPSSAGIKPNPYLLYDPVFLAGGGARSKMFAASTPIPPPQPTTSLDTTSVENRVDSSKLQRVPYFSGDDLKGDVPYTRWKFEIRCLMSTNISQNMLTLAIHQSLRGTAGTALVALGENASPDMILSKLDSLFGDVASDSMVMQEFWNSYQKPDESVSSFGCRLESLLQKAIANGHVDPRSKNDMLRHKFWTSLASDRLKSQTRHKYDSIADYNVLLKEIRAVEEEIKVSGVHLQPTPKRATAQPVVVDSQIVDLEKRFDSKLQGLEGRLDSKINQKFGQIMEKLDHLPSSFGNSNFNNNGQNAPQGNRFGRRTYGNGRSNRGRGRQSHSHGNGRGSNQGQKPKNS